MKSKAIRNGEATYRHAENIAWRRVEEDSVLLNIDSSEYYTLDPVATRIWELIGKGRNTAGIIRMITADFKASDQRIRQDVLDFTAQLIKEKLILPV